MRPPAFIFSPSSNGIHIGPLFFHAYGIAYVFAVMAAVLIARARWSRAGGDPELVGEVALWGFPAGLIGGRIYFIITTPSQVPHHWWGVFAIWQGGLGIWGGIAAGVAGGLWVLHRRLSRADVLRFMDAAAPGLLVAQAIGRIGNYFNQELFGGPTTLPWGLKIDLAHRPPGYERFATFQPTFLYEIIWNLSLAAFLVWLGRRQPDDASAAVDSERERASGRRAGRRLAIKAPGLFALYVAGYSAFRMFEETLRIDYSEHILGLRLNFFVAALLCLAGLIWFAVIQFGWRGLTRRFRRGAGVAGIAWIVACAAGCGGTSSRAQAAVWPDRVQAAVWPDRLQAAERLRPRIAETSDHGFVFATSAAVSQARRAVAIP